MEDDSYCRIDEVAVQSFLVNCVKEISSQHGSTASFLQRMQKNYDTFCKIRNMKEYTLDKELCYYAILFLAHFVSVEDEEYLMNYFEYLFPYFSLIACRISFPPIQYNTAVVAKREIKLKTVPKNKNKGKAMDHTKAKQQKITYFQST